MRIIAILVFLASLTNTGPFAIAGTMTSMDIVFNSFAVATDIEDDRQLPVIRTIAGEAVDPARYLRAAAETIVALDAGHFVHSLVAAWQMPDNPYPSFTPDAAVYGRSLSRDEYVRFFADSLDRYPPGEPAPDMFAHDGSGIRFIDALHLAASVLRFYRAFGYLPTDVGLKLASPQGLFPWDVPESMGEFVGGISNNESRVTKNLYYQNSSLDFEMYSFVKRFVGEEADPYVAGELIFDGVQNLYNQTPYGNPGLVDQFGYPSTSLSMLHNMQGTSGTPHRPKEGLYPAAGIPYGHGGAVYIESVGWINAESHRPYGSNLAENPFYYYDPVNPAPGNAYEIPLEFDDPLISAVRNEINRRGDTVGAVGYWVNPADISHYGAEFVVQTAVLGGFDHITLTVKTFLGNTYFEADPGTVRGFQFDALGPLVQAAQSSGIGVFVAIPTLSDYNFMAQMTEEERLDWAQVYFQPPSAGGLRRSSFMISPCSEDYREYLKEILSQIHHRYDVEGVVLSASFVEGNGWAGHDCEMDESDPHWKKRNYMARFVNDLARRSKQLKPEAEVLYQTAPLFDIEGRAIEGLHGASVGLLSQDVGGVVVTIVGLSWLTNEYARNQVTHELAEIAQQSTLPLTASLHLSEEWQFPPEFYRGQIRSLHGIGFSGVEFTSYNSIEGELGSAFVSQQYGTLRNVKYLDPPPEVVDVAFERLRRATGRVRP